MKLLSVILLFFIISNTFAGTSFTKMVLEGANVEDENKFVRDLNLHITLEKSDLSSPGGQLLGIEYQDMSVECGHGGYHNGDSLSYFQVFKQCENEAEISIDTVELSGGSNKKEFFKHLISSVKKSVSAEGKTTKFTDIRFNIDDRNYVLSLRYKFGFNFKVVMNGIIWVDEENKQIFVRILSARVLFISIKWKILKSLEELVRGSDKYRLEGDLLIFDF